MSKEQIQAEDTFIEDDIINEAELENPAENVEEAADEDVITIGDESPAPEEVEHAQAPAWVKELRKSNRELARENRKLKEQASTSPTSQQMKVELGAKPKLEDCDYDADKHDEALSQWYERKIEVDAQNTKAKQQQAADDQAWQDKLIAYSEAKSKIKVPDYEDAEHAAQEVLSKTQQGIILQGAENPALVVYALGKNPAKAKELAAITDPVKYAFAIAKLETQLKITKRNAPPPEQRVSGKGSASISGSVDSTLERLRAEAAKTNNLTKVIAYKAQKRQAK